MLSGVEAVLFSRYQPSKSFLFFLFKWLSDSFTRGNNPFFFRTWIRCVIGEKPSNATQTLRAHNCVNKNTLVFVNAGHFGGCAHLSWPL